MNSDEKIVRPKFNAVRNIDSITHMNNARMMELDKRAISIMNDLKQIPELKDLKTVMIERQRVRGERAQYLPIKFAPELEDEHPDRTPLESYLIAEFYLYQRAVAIERARKNGPDQETEKV